MTSSRPCSRDLELHQPGQLAARIAPPKGRRSRILAARIVHDQQFGALRGQLRYIYIAKGGCWQPDGTPGPPRPCCAGRLANWQTLRLGLDRFGSDQILAVKAQQQIGVELMLRSGVHRERNRAGGKGASDAGMALSDSDEAHHRWPKFGPSRFNGIAAALPCEPMHF
jgi:hypothetical protein